jgi:hypothetical protein
LGAAVPRHIELPGACWRGGLNDIGLLPQLKQVAPKGAAVPRHIELPGACWRGGLNAMPVA